MATAITITRFEAIPLGEPVRYAVGFSIRVENGREVYLEGLVPLEEASGKTDQQIAEVAYEKVRADADTQIARLRGQSALVGQTFETDEMRDVRLREEELAKARVDAVAEARAKDAEQNPSVSVNEARTDEEFPGGRRVEETPNDSTERSGEDEQPSSRTEPESGRRRRRAPTA